MLKILKNCWLSWYSILVAAVLGIIIGFFIDPEIMIFKQLGNIFMQLLKMLIIPVIFFSVLNSTIGIGNHNQAGKLGLLTFLYFVLTAVVAIVLGMVLVGVFQPGANIYIPQEFLENNPVTQYTEQQEIHNWYTFVMSIIPVNPFEALIRGNVTQILFFTIFLGVSLSYMNSKHKLELIDHINTINDGVVFMIRKVMVIAPIGVFSLMAYTTSALGVDSIIVAFEYIVLYVISGLILIYGILGILVHLFSNVSYLQFIKTIVPLQLIAFSTVSSLVSIPTNLQCAERLRLNDNIAKFIIPLGATVNMNGTAMHYAMVTIFFSQVFNIDLTTTVLLLVILISVVSAMGTAGVPGGGGLLMITVLIAAGIPITAVPIIFAVDRLLDMCRTVINVVGDISAVAILDKYMS